MKIIITLILLIGSNTFALDGIEERAVNGGIKIIDFKSKVTNPEVYFYDNRVLVKKLRDNYFRAFVGIPIGANVGTHSITIKNSNMGKIYFNIDKGEYKKQYITLTGKGKKYVDLNEEQIQRVLREKKILQEAKQIWSNDILAQQIKSPTSGQVTGVFGSQRFFNNKPRRPHSGIDIANDKGTAINAIANGRVILTGDFYFNGKTILLDHGQGFLSFYVHLDKILVNQEDMVKAGDKIALMGSTGRSTGPHLHISTYLNKVMVNPELIIPLDNLNI